MNQFEKKSLLILSAVIVFMMFFGIGGVPLLGDLEALYAKIISNMIDSGDYLTPRLNGEVALNNPPLYYWLAALTSNVFGMGEFAVRFPASLMAGATAILLYFSITKIFNECAGFWSALVLVSSMLFFCVGKFAIADSTFTFFVTGALLCFLHKHYWLMYVCMAFATLTFGIAGVVLPFAIIILYLIFMGQLGEISRMHLIRGALLYSMLVSPWYYAMHTVHGASFVDMLFNFNAGYSLVNTFFMNGSELWYNPVIILLGMFPWTGVLLQSIKASINDSRIDDMRILMFMHIWWAFVVMFFAICNTKSFGYIMPMFPALAIIIGWNISRMIAKLRYNTTFYSWIVGSGIMFSLLGVGCLMVGQQFPELEFIGLVLSGLIFVLGFAALFTLWYYRDVEMASWLHVATGATIMFVVFAFVLPFV